MSRFHAVKNTDHGLTAGSKPEDAFITLDKRFNNTQ